MEKDDQQLTAQEFHWLVPAELSLPAIPAGDAGRGVAIELLNGEILEGLLLSLDPLHQSLWLGFSQARIRSLALAAVRKVALIDSLLPGIINESNSSHSGQDFEAHFSDGKITQGRTRGIEINSNGAFVYPIDPVNRRIACWFLPLVQLDKLLLGGNAVQLPEKLRPADTSQEPAHHLQGDAALSTGLGTCQTLSKVNSESAASYSLSAEPIKTSDELICALHDGRSKPVKKLGQLLIENDAIDQNELDLARHAQQQGDNRRLGELLVESGAISDKTLLQALAINLGIPYVDARNFEIDANVLELIKPSVAKRHGVLPLAFSGGELIVAVANPLNFDFEQDLQFMLETSVHPVFADPDELSSRIGLEYESSLLPRLDYEHPDRSLDDVKLEHITDRLSREAKQSNQTQDELVEDASELNDNALVRFVNKIIVDAYEKRASDIHIESTKGHGSKIRLRIDGVLQDYLELEPIYRKALVLRIKVMSNLDISEHRHAQDGKINFARFAPIPIQLRVAILPTSDGAEDVVLRLLGASEPMPLQDLALGDEYLAQLLKMIHLSHGLILVCGPTGSGKTTTLHSVLREINSPERKIWTAEDPIEINQPGLRQVQINSRIGWTFAMAMRAFLRADPDIIMVGEMRDAETTKIAIEASLTGHLVFSTLHTNSAAESIVRLLEMGMDPFNFADALIGILSQRLARRLCGNCKAQQDLSEREVEGLAEEYCQGTNWLPQEIIAGWHEQYWQQDTPYLYKAKGCKYCDKGYHGRMAVYELLHASSEVKQKIRNECTIPDIQHAAISDGMKLLHQDALDKTLQGHIDLEWARRVSY